MILGSCMVVWNNNRHVKSEFLLDILLTATDYNWFFFFFFCVIEVGFAVISAQLLTVDMVLFVSIRV